jgi:hypothetical protein
MRVRSCALLALFTTSAAIGASLASEVRAEQAQLVVRTSSTPFGDLSIDENLPDNIKQLIREAYGTGELTDPGSARFGTSPTSVGSEILSVAFRHTKTGRLTEDYSSGGVPGLSKVQIKAGTLAYAAIFDRTGPAMRGPSTVVGWCIPDSKGALLQFGGQGLCFFPNGEGRAEFVPPNGGQSPFLVSSLSASRSEFGPFPKIHEEPADFGVELRWVYRLKKIRPDAVVVDAEVSDGQSTHFIRSLTIKRAPDGSAALNAEGGVFKLVPSANADSAAVETVTPLRARFQYTDIQAVSNGPSGYSMSVQGSARTLEDGQWVSRIRVFPGWGSSSATSAAGPATAR